MRLFIAINFNDIVKTQLDQLTTKIKKNTRTGTFTRKENFHLTLVFLGEVEKPDRVMEAMNKTMEEITRERFSLSIENIGRFSRKEGDLYWVGIQRNQRLNEIQKVLTKHLKLEGFVLEEREFKPHLTLGRKISFHSEEEKKKLLEQLEPIAKIETSVDRISLMKSERIKEKLVYTELYSCPMGNNSYGF